MKNVKTYWFGLLIGCMFMSLGTYGQNIMKKVRNAKGIEVIYQSSYKGKATPSKVRMKVCGDQVLLENLRTEQMTSPQTASGEKPLLTRRYLDYYVNQYYQYAELPNGKAISSVNKFILNNGFKETGTKKFLGLNCKILKTSINSNTIEVWCTNDIAFRGTPQNVGIPDGLVLRIIRNGDMIQEAISITPLKQATKLLPETWGEMMDDSDFQYAINQSGVITIPVFDQQSISFSGAKLPTTLKDNLQYNAAGGTVILKKVKLPSDISDRGVFAEVVQYSDGDAYDRTGSIFMIPTDKEQSFINALQDLNSVPAFNSGGTAYHGLVSTPSYNVPMELMRFFTGFGVRKFNSRKVPGQNWVDSVLYKQDITTLASQLQGEVWIGAYIGNWDAKGHKLSLKLKYYPDGGENKLKSIPLFNTVNYMEQAGQPYPTFMLNDSLKVTFTLTESIKNARLYYITTGHGGWGGGDEFNQKPNSIYLDGKQIISFIPWRDDCGTYRNNNPCSGNFSNGLSSSDLSRSNWCPGTVTNPEYIYIGNLNAGEHTMYVKIPQGNPEGNSNSYWCISGTLIY